MLNFVFIYLISYIYTNIYVACMLNVVKKPIKSKLFLQGKFLEQFFFFLIWVCAMLLTYNLSNILVNFACSVLFTLHFYLTFRKSQMHKLTVVIHVLSGPLSLCVLLFSAEANLQLLFLKIYCLELF